MQQPPYEITNKMLNLVSDITDKVRSISDFGGLDNKPRLRKISRIKSIHSSLAIEANSLSFGEVMDVIDGKVVFGDEKEIDEVKRAYLAYEKIDKVDPYSLKDLNMVHGVILEGGGKFRNCGEGVFDGDRCIFMAPSEKLVPELMGNLFSWMKESKDNIHPLILSSVFHYEFVFIHPYTDGNGRMARLWQTTILSNWNPVFKYLPIENQILENQQSYYDAIAACHVEGDSTKFIEFILDMIDNALSIILESKDKYPSKYVAKLLTLMEGGVPYTPVQLQDSLHLKSRDALRDNYIRPAIDDGYIEYEIPDKPKSKNQRYVKRW
ncbi:MAG: Fic family protein [Clostridia bacterium]|nr:Fic family protein [Clostridia bacterium]